MYLFRMCVKQKSKEEYKFVVWPSYTNQLNSLLDALLAYKINLSRASCPKTSAAASIASLAHASIDCV